MTTRRVTRSSGKTADSGGDASNPVTIVDDEAAIPPCFRLKKQKTNNPSIQMIAEGSPLPHINRAELSVLRAKQSQLRRTSQVIAAELVPDRHHHSGGSSIATALASTLIFTQYEAGTAVCVGADGAVLTCAHCFGESEEEWRANRYKWLLYFTGQAVLVECRRWDARRDLALAYVVAVEVGSSDVAMGQDASMSSIGPAFSSVEVAAGKVRSDTSVVCIGQPGRDDLESKTSKKTTYNLVEVSHGRFRGLVPDKDPQDCSDIGSLKHDAWTYWGHSGAPLLRVEDGRLVGVHSSWDSETAMRHGVPWIAIQSFLEEAKTGDRGDSRAYEGSVVTGLAAR